MNKQRLLISGDRAWRTWAQYELIERVIREIAPGIVMHGNAAGVDQMAHMAACRLNITPDPYPAEWETFGGSAGPIRNTKMLREGKPTIVCAFHDCLAASKGTKHMVHIARAAHVPVRLFNSQGEIAA